ncbi:MAG: type II secretion system protein [Patescibacteria group bacterium]
MNKKGFIQHHFLNSDTGNKFNISSLLKVKSGAGFTLIELLVVIAIIGMLSSLAVVSLNTARNKARDAQIKSDLSQFRTYTAVTYDTGVFTGLTIGAVTPAITPPACSQAAYLVVIGSDPVNGGTDTAWAAYAALCAGTNYFCVDSSGQAKESATIPTTASPICPTP